MEAANWLAFATDCSYRARTIVFPLMSKLAQLGNAVKLGVEIQYVLAVEALARLDKVQVGLLELAHLHDMVFGALELGLLSAAVLAISRSPSASL